MTVRKGKNARQTQAHVLKNKTKDECWYDEMVREIEKSGDARIAIQEWYDSETDGDSETKD